MEPSTSLQAATSFQKDLMSLAQRLQYSYDLLKVAHFSCSNAEGLCVRGVERTTLSSLTMPEIRDVLACVRSSRSGISQASRAVQESLEMIQRLRDSESAFTALLRMIEDRLSAASAAPLSPSNSEQHEWLTDRSSKLMGMSSPCEASPSDKSNP